MSETRPISTFVYVLLAAAIIAVAAFLRLSTLGERPVHFDEATGARIVGYDLDQKREFDPQHFHGPLLSMLTVPYVRAMGENDWLSLTITPLRTVTALAGILTVIVCLLFPARWSLTLSAAALVCTSPLLIYYSRMYIHESLFVFTGALSLLALAKYCQTRHLRWALGFGVSVGLMAATRETVVIALFSWMAAGILVWITASKAAPPGNDESKLQTALTALRHQKWPILVTGLSALATIYLCYSHFGQFHRGFFDFFRTFFVYETTLGHEKPWDYYLELLIIPKTSIGVLWTEAAVLILAVTGCFVAPAGRPRLACRFVLNSGLILFLIFSLISYKTPWLICLAWFHICLAGGFGLTSLNHFIPNKSKVLTALLIGAILIWQGVQAHRAAFQWHSDARNPYAYVPTSPDLLKLADWLNELSAQHPEIQNGSYAVIGSGYWPLPWYLRSFAGVGYYQTFETVPEIASTALIFTAQEVPAHLEQTHQWLPRGLRHEVPLWLGIRKDIWQIYQQHK